MRRGTTPTITINVTGETFENSTMYVTIEQSSLQITKTGDDVEIYPTESGCTVALFLTQEETLQFAKGSARLQIRWITSDGAVRLYTGQPYIPQAPTTDGTYTLSCTVSNGVATYSWN